MRNLTSKAVKNGIDHSQNRSHNSDSPLVFMEHPPPLAPFKKGGVIRCYRIMFSQLKIGNINARPLGL